MYEESVWVMVMSSENLALPRTRFSRKVTVLDRRSLAVSALCDVSKNRLLIQDDFGRGRRSNLQDAEDNLVVFLLPLRRIRIP